MSCALTRLRPAGVEPARIKEVAEVLDRQPLIDARMLALTRWIADYYACSWGQALDAAVPAGVKKHAGTRIATFLDGARRSARGALRAARSIRRSRPSRPRQWRYSPVANC